MHRPRVYVETTIPSFYFDQRKSPTIVARRQWTRPWWEIALERFELVTGPPVLTELLDGPESRHEEWMALVRPLPVLALSSGVQAVAEVYLRHRLMPRSGADALHLALASVHLCDYLVSWDTRHLANALKFHHISKINGMLGLHVPHILTPLELLERLS
ncbi:type II toxin-antitoxin system VapC family toxin [Longimicrobium sp.]|uniref:type II toxin-antitoxin system VapC family toxin n=1 Tax=Longimicrobium sp. TaxID=2029185 RepID=UPI002C8DD9BA|nr:type II toxin-antitoxin system VapC family toxin [Longimicrobium sp.]HSU16080.1 type II toxin-antitoxin system VapC family toxin [Longimicrobium sp.]